MKKRLPLFSAKVSVGIAENEANGRKEITLAGTIAADDDIVFRRKGLNDSLILVAVEPRVRRRYFIVQWERLVVTYLLKP